MTDQLDDKEHYYLYNDDNKLIEYGYISSDGATFNSKKTIAFLKIVCYYCNAWLHVFIMPQF